jgi:hypothetical protein
MSSTNFGSALIALSIAFFLGAGTGYAQAIPVNSTYKGFSASSEPTMTFLLKRRKRKVRWYSFPAARVDVASSQSGRPATAPFPRTIST